jgi:excisionase family DNA binding protein
MKHAYASSKRGSKRKGSRERSRRRDLLGTGWLAQPERTVIVDFTAALEQMRETLRAELLDELRTAGDTWPRWMSVDTVARYLDASPERVRKLVARHEIPYAQEGPGCRLSFDRHAIDTWMSTHTHEPRAARR